MGVETGKNIFPRTTYDLSKWNAITAVIQFHGDSGARSKDKFINPERLWWTPQGRWAVPSMVQTLSTPTMASLIPPKLKKVLPQWWTLGTMSADSGLRFDRARSEVLLREIFWMEPHSPRPFVAGSLCCVLVGWDLPSAEQRFE